jgi:hypothetical protein
MRPLFTVIKNTLLCGLILLSVSSYGNVYTVDNNLNTDDLAPTYLPINPGTNSLRKCIRFANASLGMDTIKFAITGAAPYIILVATTAPTVPLTITDPVFINGYSQPTASAGNLLIQLSGANGKDILQLNAGSDGSTIEGLVIYGNNSTSGISVNSSNNHVISGNYIGTNLAGSAAVAGSILQVGIALSGATNCTIGGSVGKSTRNIISGTNTNGISATNCTTLKIKGNFIGLGADGTTAIPNVQNGINLANPTTSVTIGGLAVQERNVISSHTNGSAILVATCTGLTIQNNYIGTDSTGIIAKGNRTGINISGSSSILIGGTTYSARNIIASSINNQGITMATCTTPIVIKGNFIGVGANGTTALGNLTGGISIVTSPTAAITIGGLTRAERNVISSNPSTAIVINACSTTTIQNNYIGTDSTGMLARGNQGGISLTAVTNDLLIGGTTYAARNLICNSTSNPGILLTTCATAIAIKGNSIGISADGSTAFGNKNYGISIQSSPSAIITIGGTTRPERNVISSSTNTGIVISQGTSATIQNNFIGTDTTGMFARGNQAGGISISNTPTVLIGGTSYSARNIVSASTGVGILISGSTTSIVIKGNFIGLAANGTSALGNSSGGITIAASPTATVTLGGPTNPERNVISSNVGVAFQINGTGSASAMIQNNYIGTDSTGMFARGNQTGINISNTPVVSIGGTSYVLRNIVSACTGGVGITISSSTTSIVIKGNFIGLAANGITALGNSSNGITITNSPTATVTLGGPTNPERNVISSNVGTAFQISTPGGSASATIQNNYIGTDSTGMFARGNQTGIDISATPTILIGGTSYSTRNIVSASTSSYGITISGCSTSVVIKSNIIGLAADGIKALDVAVPFGNKNNGVNIISSPNATITIGGVTIPERNIISSNLGRGLLINSSVSATIQNNFIGTDSTGLLSRGNNQAGIDITATPTILIGGTSYSARNIVSASTGSLGITITGCSTSVVIKGNIIGLSGNGTSISDINGVTFSNLNNGITVQNSPNATVTLGGPTKPERNVISNNKGTGFLIGGSSGALSVTIQNNYIGTDSTGMLARGNQAGGITINNTPTVLIGGTSYSLRNIVSASTGVGITITGCSTSVVIKGNIIGLSGNGTSVSDINGVTFSNSSNGITVQSSPNATVTLGGPTKPERNVISNNKGIGLLIGGSGALSATIQNNYIGTDSTGMFARGNQTGISISNTPTILIGGTSYSLRNIISASTNNQGITIATCTNSIIIKGNFVGLAANGTGLSTDGISMGNKDVGISINNSLTSNVTIGGITLSERNIISSNLQVGLSISQCATATIQNNYVGTDSTGLLNFGNGNHGISVSTCNGLLIGGTVYAARNLVCGSAGNGIAVNAGCPGAIIKANFCGIGKDGITVISNQGSGIYFGGSNSNGAVIGGSTFVERNVSSGNGTTPNAFFYSRDGIRIEGGSTNHVIKGNYCGVDSTGTIPLGNVWAGISINEGTDCIVGGTGTYEGNISGDNKDEGVYFRNALRITFIGNFVGTDKTGTIDLGNGDYGVNIRLASTDNVIGGVSIADQNYIAYTKGNLAGSGPGVYVDTMSTRNKIVRNKIYCNATKGIVLVNSSANEGIAAPVLITSLTNTVNGTGSINGDSIHVYLNIKSGGNCDCEGETYVGGTIVSGGAWSLTHNLTLSTAQANRITATETTVNNSTSEFSTCLDPLPVNLISFDAKKQADHTVLVEWSTASEQNNKDFEVQRSTDGVHFQTIEIVAGSGNSIGIKNYSIIDTNAPDGIVYYKLKQVDINETSAYSKIVSVDFSLGKLSIIQNNDGFTIVVPEDKNNVTYQVYSITGSLVAQGSFSPSGTQHSFKVNLVLAPAMYMVSAIQGNSFETQKIIISE